MRMMMMYCKIEYDDNFCEVKNEPQTDSIPKFG